jgi:hypothetical protein
VRNPNRRTRRNTKVRELKRLKDKPQSGKGGNDGKESTEPLPRAAIVGVAEINPTATTKPQAQQSHETEEQSGHRMGTLKAAGSFVRRLFGFVIGFLDKNSGAVTAIATIAIGILTWEYVTYSKKQWETMQDSNRTSREALVTVQRGFIRFNDVALNGFIFGTASGEKHVFQAHSNWINTGATPAIEVIQAFHFDELPSEPSDIQFADPIEPHNNQLVVGPNGILSAGHINKPEDFILPGIDKLNHKSITVPLSRKIFTWGWVAYRDIFVGTNPHLAEFCQQLTGVYGTLPSKNDSGEGLGFNWNSCDRHNCVDQYCSDYKVITGMMRPSPAGASR